MGYLSPIPANVYRVRTGSTCKSTKGGKNHYGSERQEAAEAKAQRILKEELRKLGWTAGELGQRKKGDPGKVRIAQRLRKETTVTLKWVAQHLQMGSWSYAANKLYACQKNKK